MFTFAGMAGNQVLEWADLDTEIKTAGLKNVRLVPFAPHFTRSSPWIESSFSTRPVRRTLIMEEAW